MEIIGHHKKGFRLVELARFFVAIKLIYGVKNLFLYTRRGVQFVLRNERMNLVHNRKRSLVSVRINLTDKLVVFIQKRVVHPPSVYADAYRNFSCLFTFFKPLYNAFKKSFVIPYELAVLVFRAVFETVNFFQNKLTVLDVSEDMSAARCAYVYRKKIFVCHCLYSLYIAFTVLLYTK